MVAVPSTMLPLGTPLPDFTLTDAVTDAPVSPADFENRRGLLVMFICNHCPFVKHVLPELGRIAADYEPQGVGVVAINSNDIESYPADAPDQMRALAIAEGWTFPFVLDDTQEIAKAFRAACTPDFFLFDAGRALVYRGQLDGSRPSNDVPVTGADLRAALDALLGGKSLPSAQQPSIGCNIKWKPENEPAYFGTPGT